MYKRTRIIIKLGNKFYSSNCHSLLSCEVLSTRSRLEYKFQYIFDISEKAWDDIDNEGNNKTNLGYEQ